ncbi:MAG: tetratricopeptide repeat protein [Deltaproteobacteria bacterium]|nr:MAG: tetratricopeptide repeat protein [Deltaproteobacteria bacterium]
MMDEIELYQQMLTKDPSSQAFVFLAEAYLERKMYEEAIETCAAGLRLRPHDLRARVILGLSCLGTGALDRAEAELLKAREMLQINAVIYDALAELYEVKGDHDRAAGYREVSRAINPAGTVEVEGTEVELEEDKEPEAELEPIDIPQEEPEMATVTMAELYEEQGYPEKAVAVYRKIIETAPGTAGVEERLAGLEKQIRDLQDNRVLLSILEHWYRKLQERTADGTAQQPSEARKTDPEKLAAFIRNHVKQLCTS